MEEESKAFFLARENGKNFTGRGLLCKKVSVLIFNSRTVAVIIVIVDDAAKAVRLRDVMSFSQIALAKIEVRLMNARIARSG